MSPQSTVHLIYIGMSTFNSCYWKKCLHTCLQMCLPNIIFEEQYKQFCKILLLLNIYRSLKRWMKKVICVWNIAKCKDVSDNRDHGPPVVCKKVQVWKTFWWSEFVILFCCNKMSNGQISSYWQTQTWCCVVPAWHWCTGSCGWRTGWGLQTFCSCFDRGPWGDDPNVWTESQRSQQPTRPAFLPVKHKAQKAQRTCCMRSLLTWGGLFRAYYKLSAWW